jgi:hypothetical protein
MYWKMRMTSNLGKLHVAERQIYYESDDRQILQTLASADIFLTNFQTNSIKNVVHITIA